MEKNSQSEDVLKPRQRLAAELMVDHPNLTAASIAEQVGVNVATLYRWRQTAEFKEYTHALCQERFKDIEKLAVQRLRENVERGNQRAIEYVLDCLSYQPEQKIDVYGVTIKVDIDE